MPDEPTDGQQDLTDEGGENTNVKQMRDHIKRLESQLEEAADAEAVKRENAFLKAGVDMDSKAGKLLFKAYDGNLDADDIRKDAAELNALKEPGQTKEEPEGPELQEGEAQSTEQRQKLAANAAPDDGKSEDPRKVALANATKVLQDGGTRDDAVGEAFGEIAWAGYKENDSRVIFNPRDRE